MAGYRYTVYFLVINSKWCILIALTASGFRCAKTITQEGLFCNTNTLDKLSLSQVVHIKFTLFITAGIMELNDFSNLKQDLNLARYS